MPFQAFLHINEVLIEMCKSPEAVQGKKKASQCHAAFVRKHLTTLYLSSDLEIAEEKAYHLKMYDKVHVLNKYKNIYRVL